MANQILAGAVFQAGQVIAGVDADTILDTFIAPQLLTTTSTRWMIVGAYLDDDNGDSSGSVYVYDATDLSAQPTKLTAFDGTERDRFGNAVAATDDKIIVGAYRYGNDGNDYVGSVYVYDANDLSAQPTKLTAFDGASSDNFGISVSATADKIVVGAYSDDDNGNNSGSVYVYDANDLTAQPTKLTAFDGVGDDLFGNAVSVTADKIVVGATYEGDGGWPGSGSVYVYDANDLTAQPTKLTPFDGAGGDRFGESVFATVDKIVVGAWRDDDNGNDSGSVYVYDLSDLSAQPTKLTAFDGAANHRFGYSVAATVDKIIVGAEQDDDNGSYSGSVYVYDATDLSAQPTKLTAFDGAEDDHFGYSLDAVSNTLLVGSFYDDGQGSSYIYDLDDLSAQPTKITAFDGSSNDRFGHSVALCVETTTIPLPTFIAPSSSSSTVANKIFMWSSDAAAYQNGVGRSDVGGLVMTDGDFSNPTTIQLDSPQMVVGGEGKVVTISYLGEIKVYDESTGQLEQTFNDSYLDSTKAASLWDSAEDAVIGAGKIFINSPEENPNGVGSIIVVDLLDRNVATYLITPTLGIYSRFSSASWGGIEFIDGRIYGHTSQWSSADQGIWHFAPDGSDQQFIPVPGMGTFSGLVKWGDNFVVTEGSTIEVIDSSGTTLHSVTKTYASQTYAFGKDLGVTSTGKLVVSNRVSNNPMENSIFLYDEGLTNEIEFKPADISNGTDSKWGYGTIENSGSFEVFGEYILVSAKEADNNGITNCGAVYRYNDSGVLQDIFYGTVADQKIGTNISIGTATTTTALPTFIAPPLPPTPATWVAVGAWADDDNGETSGSTYVYDINNLTAQPTKLTAFDGAGGDYFGWSVSGNNDKIVVGAKYDGDNGLYSGSVYVFDANDLSAQPTKLTAFDGASGDQYSLCTVTTNDKVIVGSAYDDDDGTNSGSVYVYDANDLSAAPTKLKAFDAASGSWFGQAVASNDDKILVGAPSDSNIGAYSENGAVYVYDANDLSAQPTKLTAFDAANVDLFGSSISATADKIVVGAYSDDDMGNTSGSVYVFDANDLSAQPIKLTAFDGESDDYFGWSVCVNSDNIFVGAHGDDDEANAAGAVYVYDLSDLSAQPTKLTAFDGASSDNFGRSLTVSEDNLFVGSYLDDDNGGESGSVYVYDLSDLSAQPTKLTAFDAASGDRFGASVAVG